MRVAVLTSTGGSVVRAAASHCEILRRSLAMFVGDRECEGLELGRHLGLPTVILAHGREFSDELVEEFRRNRIDYAYVFFTRLLYGALLQEYRGRLVNFHPSLLPASPGLDGFGDSLRSHAIVIGSTVHFIDESVDGGPQILQTVLPVIPGQSKSQLRHGIFIQQCRSIIQVHEWLADGRVSMPAERVHVRGSRYEAGEFIPGLDSDEAISFQAPAVTSPPRDRGAVQGSGD